MISSVFWIQVTFTQPALKYFLPATATAHQPCDSWLVYLFSLECCRNFMSKINDDDDDDVDVYERTGHLELQHIAVLNNQLTGGYHVDGRTRLAVPRHHRPSRRATDPVAPQSPSRVEFPPGLVQPFEVLRQTAWRNEHTSNMDVVQRPTKMAATFGAGPLPPAKSGAGAAGFSRK